MKWSSIKEFIYESLPFYFREYDSYKRSDGGVLKRFLDVCSEYFDEEVLRDIDNFTSIWNIDNTSPVFLNYIWEYLGSIPYAYGILYDGKPFSKDNLKELSTEYIRNDNCPIPTVDYRRLLKYAISLYKIRCTKEFYTILGRLYGLEISVVDPSENESPYKEALGLSIASSWETQYDIKGYYDQANTLYDRAEACASCVRLEASIHIPKNLYDILSKRNSLDNAKAIIIDILNRYLPIQALPFSTKPSPEYSTLTFTF